MDIFIYHNEESTEKWNEVLIHGSPEGLESLAKLLMEIAELDQEKTDNTYLPPEAREHYCLRPGLELSRSSVSVLIGRLDAKGTGEFYDRYVPK
ncbi:Imm32 family immunity protein [Hymenobacter sp. 102]|uniref:Imm32 family immunity protein n=1 Tax=Hymenobacter sp. 102 TaxID=3403152 RepID=UPI003CF10DF3